MLSWISASGSEAELSFFFFFFFAELLEGTEV